MLTPVVVAALTLFTSESADQGRWASQAPPVVQATQATQAGPSLAGFGVFVWAPSAKPADTQPRSFWNPFEPKAGSAPVFTLFGSTSHGDGRTVTVPLPSGAATRKVVCGTTVIIVDSRVDPKFVFAPRPGAGESTIRTVPKPMCGQGQR